MRGWVNRLHAHSTPGAYDRTLEVVDADTFDRLVESHRAQSKRIAALEEAARTFLAEYEPGTYKGEDEAQRLAEVVPKGGRDGQ